ncbi:unnamed protein product [Allacma fusca]|uniref:Uncharacterized protein n=1 Tax=Allacma fusca TaxID=39272 RepID=A0A8J2P276_9HEXA|nr:unnamed protein product [Allacma fusca]
MKLPVESMVSQQNLMPQIFLIPLMLGRLDMLQMVRGTYLVYDPKITQNDACAWTALRYHKQVRYEYKIDIVLQFIRAVPVSNSQNDAEK